MKVKEKNNRKILQFITGGMLPIMLIGGYIWPYVGFGIAVMMVGFLTLSFFKGRVWCGWACPRGAFMERYFHGLSLHIRIPAFFKALWFRLFVIAALMTSFVMQLILSGGDLSKIGMVFVRMCIVTSIIAIPLGMIYKPRVWCSFCPMGTIQGFLGRTRNLLHIDEKDCSSCNLCEKVCPIQTNPSSYKKEGVVESKDCIKCGNCVLNCPKKVVDFKNK